MVIDPVQSIQECMHRAMLVDLKEIQYPYRKPGESGDKVGSRLHRNDEILIRVVPETWGDTSLGMGGMAGQVVTTAHTVIIESTMTGEILIYRGHRLFKRFDRRNIPESVQKRYGHLFQTPRGNA